MRCELPTLGLLLAVYAGWSALTWHWAALPLPLVVLLGGWLLAWHGSLQHEAIHGHPTASPRLNACLAGLPLGLWLPYARYRQSHLAHHASALTSPLDDPESYFVDAATWSRMGPTRRGFAWVMQTLAGRLLLGPPLLVARFLADEARALARGRHLLAWALHGLGLALVLSWLHVCDVPLGLYALAVVYPGTSLTLLRSFAEHRPDPDPERRTVIVEAGLPWGLLFLFNNLHVVHHAHPGLPWYAIPARYRAERERWVAESAERIRGYAQVARRWGLRPHAPPVWDTSLVAPRAATGAR